MADGISNIATKRWEKETCPNRTSIRDMLVVALERLDAGELLADHMIIAFGHTTDDGRFGTGYFNAGSFNDFAQIGLLEHAKKAMAGD